MEIALTDCSPGGPVVYDWAPINNWKVNPPCKNICYHHRLCSRATAESLTRVSLAAGRDLSLPRMLQTQVLPRALPLVRYYEPRRRRR